ncbi:hypothetical protein [Streptomyces macrosporus]|uniref:hypothetical protein n=1 Tax=Streptomyces macrosporus TaxID=44032 RepID=UPI0031E0AE2B
MQGIGFRNRLPQSPLEQFRIDMPVNLQVIGRPEYGEIRLHLLRIPDAFLRTGQRKYLCIASGCLRTIHDSLTGQLHPIE